MGRGRTTFVIASDDRSPISDALVDSGFRFESGSAETVALLDTVDGRLRRAGLQLELREGDRLELVLAGDGIVSAHLEPSGLPRFASDLGDGPFRSRVEATIGSRALLARVRIHATRSDAVFRDDEGRLLTRVVMLEDLAWADPDVSTSRTLPWGVVEIHDVADERTSANHAVAALQQLGLLAVKGDALSVLARHAGVDLNGVNAAACVTLDPAMPAVVGVSAVLAGLGELIAANWQGTIDNDDPEFLHDLRIAMRRTRSVISHAKGILPGAVVATADDGFGWLSALTGPARDLDVYLIEWDSYVSPLGIEAADALGPVRELLVQRQANAHATLDSAMRSTAGSDLIERWPVLLADIPNLNPRENDRGDRALGGFVGKRLERAQARLIERGRLITPDTPAEQVHDLRKDAKTLRYLLECFASLTADAPRKRFVKRLKALQDNLGAHQDAEVHVALLRDLSSDLRGTPPATFVALGQLTERLDHVRVAARADFATRFAAYDTDDTQQVFAKMLQGLRS